MATNFTSKNPGLPPTRNKPGTLGTDAAKRGAKAQATGPGSSRGGATSPPRLTARRKGAGPDPAPSGGEEEQPDFRHAVIAAQYQNMRQLGRDIPLGVSLIRNGHYRDILPEGQRPFDLFLDA